MTCAAVPGAPAAIRPAGVAPSHARSTCSSIVDSRAGGAVGWTSVSPSSRTYGSLLGTSHGRIAGSAQITSPSLSIAHASKYARAPRTSSGPGANVVAGAAVIRPQPTGPKNPIVSFFTQYRCQYEATSSSRWRCLALRGASGRARSSGRTARSTTWWFCQATAVWKREPAATSRSW
jgi:hypothetical protein